MKYVVLTVDSERFDMLELDEKTGMYHFFAFFPFLGDALRVRDLLNKDEE